MATFSEIMRRTVEIMRALVIPLSPQIRFLEAPDKITIEDHPGFRYAYRLFRVEMGDFIEAMEYHGPLYATEQSLIIHVAYFFDPNSVEASDAERMAATDLAYVVATMKSPPPDLTFQDLASQLKFDSVAIDRENNYIKMRIGFRVGYELT